MDYALGLRTLGARLPENALSEFSTLENRLQENLRNERLFGSSETVRADRAAIIYALNELARTQVGTSFNELSESESAPRLPGAGALNANQPKEDTTMRPIRILFLAANPKDTDQLRLDEEVRAIDEALLQKAEFRDKFDLKQQFAVRVSDLQGHFLRYKPDIVHFSGHGSTSSEIILEDNSGNSQAVSKRALTQLFAVLKDNIRCVVLNSCYSAPQAEAIAAEIDCVIGMSKAIGDEAAIDFAKSFYQAIGFGRDIDTAFQLGIGQIDLEGLDEQDTPKLLCQKSNPKEIVFVQAD